ncbi:hypothetical protein ACFSEO_09350 [Agromyces cerinus subsp. nitratus]|uniref:hypothetical protein n=1 Tax=Agromyces cerinus TaxID=33878 RepID=UPI003630BE0B
MTEAKSRRRGRADATSARPFVRAHSSSTARLAAIASEPRLSVSAALVRLDG